MPARTTTRMMTLEEVSSCWWCLSSTIPPPFVNGGESPRKRSSWFLTSVAIALAVALTSCCCSAETVIWPKEELSDTLYHKKRQELISDIGPSNVVIIPRSIDHIVIPPGGYHKTTEDGEVVGLCRMASTALIDIFPKLLKRITAAGRRKSKGRGSNKRKKLSIWSSPKSRLSSGSGSRSNKKRNSRRHSCDTDDNSQRSDSGRAYEEIPSWMQSTFETFEALDLEAVAANTAGGAKPSSGGIAESSTDDTAGVDLQMCVEGSQRNFFTSEAFGTGFSDSVVQFSLRLGDIVLLSDFEGRVLEWGLTVFSWPETALSTEEFLDRYTEEKKTYNTPMLHKHISSWINEVVLPPESLRFTQSTESTGPVHNSATMCREKVSDAEGRAKGLLAVLSIDRTENWLQQVFNAFSKYSFGKSHQHSDDNGGGSDICVKASQRNFVEKGTGRGFGLARIALFSRNGGKQEGPLLKEKKKMIEWGGSLQWRQKKHGNSESLLELIEQERRIVSSDDWKNRHVGWTHTFVPEPIRSVVPPPSAQIRRNVAGDVESVRLCRRHTPSRSAEANGDFRSEDFLPLQLLDALQSKMHSDWIQSVLDSLVSFGVPAALAERSSKSSSPFDRSVTICMEGRQLLHVDAKENGCAIAWIVMSQKKGNKSVRREFRRLLEWGQVRKWDKLSLSPKMYSDNYKFKGMDRGISRYVASLPAQVILPPDAEWINTSTRSTARMCRTIAERHPEFSQNKISSSFMDRISMLSNQSSWIQSVLQSFAAYELGKWEDSATELRLCLEGNQKNLFNEEDPTVGFAESVIVATLTRDGKRLDQFTSRQFLEWGSKGTWVKEVLSPAAFQRSLTKHGIHAAAAGHTLRGPIEDAQPLSDADWRKNTTGQTISIVVWKRMDNAVERISQNIFDELRCHRRRRDSRPRTSSHRRRHHSGSGATSSSDEDMSIKNSDDDDDDNDDDDDDEQGRTDESGDWLQCCFNALKTYGGGRPEIQELEDNAMHAQLQMSVSGTRVNLEEEGTGRGVSFEKIRLSLMTMRRVEKDTREDTRTYQWGSTASWRNRKIESRTDFDRLKKQATSPGVRQMRIARHVDHVDIPLVLLVSDWKRRSDRTTISVKGCREVREADNQDDEGDIPREVLDVLQDYEVLDDHDGENWLQAVFDTFAEHKFRTSTSVTPGRTRTICMEVSQQNTIHELTGSGFGVAEVTATTSTVTGTNSFTYELVLIWGGKLSLPSSSDEPTKRKNPGAKRRSRSPVGRNDPKKQVPRLADDG